MDEPLLTADKWSTGQTSTFRVNGLTLSVERAAGRAPTCIFLHGFAEGGFVWRGLVPRVTQGLSALIPDLRGHGRSDWSPARDYSLSSFADDLTALLEQLNCRSFIVIGHSMGAGLAVKLAQQRIPGLAGLALIDWATEMRRHEAGGVVATMAASHRRFAGPAAYLEWLKASRPLARAERLPLFVEGNLQASPLGGCEPRWDPALIGSRPGFGSAAAAWTALATIHTPWLLIRGRASSVLSRDVADAMVATAPRGRLAVIDRAGHGVMTDNPDAVCDVLANFVAEIAT
jgi:N-formylmaleamate deformylase